MMDIGVAMNSFNRQTLRNLLISLTMATSSTNKEKRMHIHIEGRRWFEKLNGSTYHSVQVWVDGKSVIVIPFSYGYGDGYIQTAHEALDDLGIVPRTKYSNEIPKLLRRICEEQAINLTTSVADVGRRRNLHSRGKSNEM